MKTHNFMQSAVHQGINMDGKRLEIVRKRLDINKSELARRIGSPQSHISKVLNGKESIGKHLSEQIVKQLHLNKEWWETGNGDIFTYTDSLYIHQHGRKNHNQTNIGSTTTITGSTGSITDELIKLVQLRDAGELSEDEFQLIKKKLLT